MSRLPVNHFQHLKKLADLRRCDISSALDYLVEHIDPDKNNWIDERLGYRAEEREIDLDGHDRNTVISKIQGLPRNIRPVTDGPYLDDFSFFVQQPGLLGIEAEGVKMLDFEMATDRDRRVFALVKDLIPEMTVEQYRIYNTFNSQYLRLVRQPRLFTMPRIHAPAIDAGCYVGYKALALAQFTGGHEILAFEIASDNFDVLKMNIQNNQSFSITPMRVALSDREQEMAINTRNQRTMAHSLTPFDQLKEANTSLLESSQHNSVHDSISTKCLDEFTSGYKEISALHISVNGHEPDVASGGARSLQKSDIIRISCPYKLGDRPIFDIVVDVLRNNKVNIFGKSGAAVIAGKKLGEYHAIPLAN